MEEETAAEGKGNVISEDKKPEPSITDIEKEVDSIVISETNIDSVIDQKPQYGLDKQIPEQCELSTEENTNKSKEQVSGKEFELKISALKELVDILEDLHRSKKFEYQILSSVSVPILNKVGDAGWELVCFSQPPMQHPQYIFKREVLNG